MRRLIVLMLALMPFVAAGQTVTGDDAMAQHLLARQPDQVKEVEPGVVVPLWLGSNGHLLALKANRSSSGAALASNAPLSLSVVDASSLVSTGLQYNLSPNLRTHAQVSQQSWVNQPDRLIGSEVGATYDLGRYSLGLSVGSTTTPDNQNPLLPRVLPQIAPSVNGLADFDSSSQVNARGRVALTNQSGIDIGASAGRIHLLPGNLLGINTLDQKAFTFGVDHGPITGMLIGRTMEPLIPGNGYAADRRWNSVDLGVTWKLPWRGSLSVGAQNLWSSGNAANTPAGPEPDQSRTPYVQYHQDL